jgi:16S rRNA (guanine527-N7)-methyltransferase
MTEGREAFLAKVDVSRETLERLEIYATLLRKWNPAINLVAPSTLPGLWRRHFLDSAQILSLAPKGARSWVDLGTGGGFPGLIVAILAAEARPEILLTCIESDQRKATFLRTVVRETGVDAIILPFRIENTPPQNADVVSARALAPLPRLLELAARHLNPAGLALFLKGAGYGRELEEALEKWSFAVDTIPSQTESEAVILKIGEIERV